MALATSGGPRRATAASLRLGCALLRLTRYSLPNLLTLARLLAAAPLFYLLQADAFATALPLLAAALLSDLVDGQLARWSGACTPLGAALDPLADKLLIAAVLLATLDEALLPVLLVALILLRDVLLVATAVAAGRGVLDGSAAVRPLYLGKLTTAAQMILVFTVVGVLAEHGAASAALTPLVLLASGLTLLSLLDYLRVYRRVRTAA